MFIDFREPADYKIIEVLQTSYIIIKNNADIAIFITIIWYQRSCNTSFSQCRTCIIHKLGHLTLWRWQKSIYTHSFKMVQTTIFGNWYTNYFNIDIHKIDLHCHVLPQKFSYSVHFKNYQKMSKFHLWDIYHLILPPLVYKKYEIWKNGKKRLSKKKVM